MLHVESTIGQSSGLLNVPLTKYMLASLALLLLGSMFMLKKMVTDRYGDRRCADLLRKCGSENQIKSKNYEFLSA